MFIPENLSLIVKWNKEEIIKLINEYYSRKITNINSI